MNAASATQGRIGPLSMLLALALASSSSMAHAGLQPLTTGPTVPPLTPERGPVPGVCSLAKKAEVLAAAVSSASCETDRKCSVIVDCSLTLAAGDVVTKQLLFEGAGATGATLTCNGATIDGRPTWNRDEPRSIVKIYSTPDPATGGRPGRPGERRAPPLQHHRLDEDLRCDGRYGPRESRTRLHRVHARQCAAQHRPRRRDHRRVEMQHERQQESKRWRLHSALHPLGRRLRRDVRLRDQGRDHRHEHLSGRREPPQHLPRQLLPGEGLLPLSRAGRHRRLQPQHLRQ